MREVPVGNRNGRESVKRERALALARKWANGQVCSLRHGEAKEYHELFISLLERFGPNDPLTAEDLMKMVGQPVWVESAKRREWMILWGYNEPEVYGRAFLFTRRTAQKEAFSFSAIGTDWKAYRHQPEGKEDT